MCRRVMLGLCVAAIIVVNVVQGQSCPGGYRFTTQPPSQLTCNPVDRFISLQCTTGSSLDIVNWYWTQDACDAGVSGTAILPGDTNDTYEFANFGSTSNRQISFTAIASTLGYYWCEISNAVNVTVRPSIITPVLQPTDTSLVLCTNQIVLRLHNTTSECAAVGSPIVYPRTPSPSSCTVVTSSTIILSMSSSITKTSFLFTTHSSSFLISPSPSPIVTLFSSPISTSLLLFHVSPSSSSIHSSSSSSSSVSVLIPTDPSSQLTPSMTLSLLSSTIQTISSSSVQQTLPSATTQDMMITQPSHTVAISVTSSPQQPLSPSLTPSSSTLPNTTEFTVLVALIGICVGLAIAAVIIILAILILCVLTRKGRSKPQSSYKGGRTGDAVDGVAFRELGSQEKVNGLSNILYATPSPTGGSLETKTPDSMIMSELYITTRPGRQLENKMTGADMKSFCNPVYDVGLDNTPSSRSPPSSFGLGDMGNNPPAAYSQPYRAQKRQQLTSGGEKYNKLTQPTTTSPLSSTSSYSHPDVTKMTSLSPVEQDYDEVAVTPKLERAAPVPPPTIAYYDDVAADAVPKLSHHHDQSAPHPFSHSLSPPKTTIDTEPQYDDPWESRSRGGSFRAAPPRGPNLFDDPSYATPTPSPHSSDSVKKSGQFQFSVHYEVDPNYHHNH